MIRRPPRSTRTDTLFPYTTLFRSRPCCRTRAGAFAAGNDDRLRRQPHLDARRVRGARVRDRNLGGRTCARDPDDPPTPLAKLARARRWHAGTRAEERRVGTECVWTFTSGWSP